MMNKKGKSTKRPAGIELQDDQEPLSLYPLDLEQALKAAMKVKPPEKAKRPGRKKKEEQPPTWAAVF